MSTKKRFHYTACGLPDVWLANGFTVRQTSEGEAFHIDQVKDLHQAIGLSIVEKEGLLTSDEFRFLRTEMCFSRRSLGELLDISGETIKKWESGENDIQKTADACLRNLYLHHIHNDTVKALISSINSHERQETKICLSKTTQGWLKTA